MAFKKLGKDLESIMRKLRGLSKIDKEAINVIIHDLQRALLSADVKVELVFQMTENIKKEAMNNELKRARRKDFVIKLVHDELVKIIGGKPTPIRIKSGKSNILLLVGIQGSGKTTTIGKLLRFYKSKGYKVAAVTADTWRPGAYEQLEQLTSQIGVKCYGNPNEKNTIKLVVRQTKKAINDKNDIIIVDTAGRHKEEKELMKEMEKIEANLKPDEVILVIDGSLGQQAYSQAEEFAKATNIGSIIVTKLDGTAKGGGALSACAATNQSIRFIGVGEKLEDFEEFNPTRFIGTLLGIPDIGSLVNRVQEAEINIDPDSVKRMMKGKFTLDDLLTQLKNIKRVGKIKQIFAIMGGGNIPEVITNDAEKSLEKWEVILNSLTQEEKDDPKIIKKTRKRRIGIGSGTDYATINRMLDQYNQMKKYMKKALQMQRMGRGGGTSLPPGFDNIFRGFDGF
ncbi:MAG: signal recognition particle protein [Candidatus Lokiarchaeota archaeon]|nr:signal recognition particle protein [Candidatus Lokiarchaeota archaeon]